jgi:hypothetical protein
MEAAAASTALSFMVDRSSSILEGLVKLAEADIA